MPGTRSRRRGCAALVPLLACLIAAPPGGCAACEEPAAAPDFETRVALRNAAGAVASQFRGGEAITFVVTLRNLTDAPRTLTLPTSQTHDGLVYDGNRKEIWRYSAGRMFAQVITGLTLAPGESRAFTVTWKQIDAQGRPVPPGGYEVVGLVPGSVPGCRSGAVPFTIGPPAGKQPAAKDPAG